MLRKILLSTGIVLILTAIMFYIWAGELLAQNEKILVVVSNKDIAYGTVIDSKETALQYLKVVEVPKYLVAEETFNSKVIANKNQHIPPILYTLKNMFSNAPAQGEEVKEQLIAQFVGKVFQVTVPKNLQITKDMVVSQETLKSEGVGLYSFLVKKENVGGGEIKNGYVVDIWCKADNEPAKPILKSVRIANATDMGENFLVSVYFSAEEIKVLESVAKEAKIFLVRVQQ